MTNIITLADNREHHGTAAASTAVHNDLREGYLVELIVPVKGNAELVWGIHMHVEFAQRSEWGAIAAANAGIPRDCALQYSFAAFRRNADGKFEKVNETQEGQQGKARKFGDGSWLLGSVSRALQKFVEREYITDEQLAKWHDIGRRQRNLMNRFNRLSQNRWKHGRESAKFAKMTATMETIGKELDDINVEIQEANAG